MPDHLNMRPNPDSTTAAIIYMAMERRAGAGRSIRGMSAATGVAENTIKQAYREPARTPTCSSAELWQHSLVCFACIFFLLVIADLFL
jgi:transcription initiation factor TFIIIB Brf1 subunit/transcription initiation factor TFIIB